MNINTEKEKVCLNKIVEEKTEVITLEGDSIVPDVKPDVITAIDTCGNICIYKKEILDGRIRIDGCIDVYVVYLTESDDGVVRGLNTTLDFTHIMEIKDANPNMNLELSNYLKTIECKVLNGRKINIKANVEFCAIVSENREEDIIKEITDVEDIQKQNRMIEINALKGNGNTKVAAKETVAINENDNLAEILKVDCDIKNKEYKTSYNKILAKAEASLRIMYLTEDNIINNIQTNIPIMGFIDIPNIADDDMCDLNYSLKNILIKPNSVEEHSMGVELEVDIDGNVYNTKEIEMIEDLYNPNYNVNFTTKNLETIANKSKCAQTVMLDENINLEGIANEKIYDMEVKPVITSASTINDKILFEGETSINILFQSNTSTSIESKNITIPFNTEINIGKNNSQIKFNTNIEVKSQDVNINNQTAEIKIELEVMATMYKAVELKMIDTLNMEEYEDNTNYGMSIYFVKEGDTLWKIAKRFRTTIEEICQTNNIEDCNKIQVGQQLFIPKYQLKNRKKLA